MNRSEGGFTLMELLMAVTILGIIISALAGGLIAYMRVSGETADRLGETPQIQVASTYFASDVQSAERVRADEFLCGGAADGRLLVSLNWTDPHPDPSDDVPVNVSYVSAVVTSTNQEQVEIRRLSCKGNQPDPQRTTLVKSGNPGVTPRIICDEDELSRCENPRRVDLVFDLCTARASGECRDDDPIPVTLTGVRRGSS